MGSDIAARVWIGLHQTPFFESAVLESSTSVRGHRIIGFGASVLISSAFAQAELADPRPDINSRLIASIDSGQPVLADRDEVAKANAGKGVEVLVLVGTWRDEILNPAERQEVQTLLASSFMDQHAGYRVRRVIHETVDEPTQEFLRRSIVYEVIAKFAGVGRVTHLMTGESVKAVPASVGNIVFSFREPVLRLRASDQELLRAALMGATDTELASELDLTLAAVKARWRSAFMRIAECMPELAGEFSQEAGRGVQKRHRVLGYLRSHPEELRPYEWRSKKDTHRSQRAHRGEV